MPLFAGLLKVQPAVKQSVKRRTVDVLAKVSSAPNGGISPVPPPVRIDLGGNDKSEVPLSWSGSVLQMPMTTDKMSEDGCSTTHNRTKIGPALSKGP